MSFNPEQTCTQSSSPQAPQKSTLIEYVSMAGNM